MTASPELGEDVSLPRSQLSQPLPKLQRLTHASWEDLSPTEDQAVSQETSGFLPASPTQMGTAFVSPITSFAICDQK
jgi:hypothetical protein